MTLQLMTYKKSLKKVRLGWKSSILDDHG